MDARPEKMAVRVLPSDRPYAHEVGQPIANACRVLGVTRRELADLVAAKLQRQISLVQLTAWEHGDQEIPGVVWLALRDLTREPVSALLGEMEMFEGLLELENRIADLNAAIAAPR